MSNYLAEAFKQMDLLTEEDFALTDKGIDELGALLSAEDSENIEVIDADAEEVEELEDSYVGKVILDCVVCHSKIYKDAENVVIDEDRELANIDEECPYCYSVEGYKIVGQIAPFEEKEEADVKVEVEDKIEDEINEAADDAVDDISDVEESEDDSTELVEESYKRLQEKNSVVIKNAYSDAPQVLYAIEQYATALKSYMENDKYAAHFGFPDRLAQGAADLAKAVTKFNGQSRKTGIETPSSSRYYDYKLFKKPKELSAMLYDLGTELGNSVNTIVNEIPNPRAKNDRKYLAELQQLLRTIASGAKSVATDVGHVKKGETKLFGGKFKEGLEEDLEKVEIETEDSVITVSEEPKEKSEAPAEEVIAPLDVENKEEIVSTTNDVEDFESDVQDSAEDEFVDQDFEEFDEEEFDELGESYLKRVYDNVESFKTSNVSTKGNTLKLEGIITFASGNKKATTFLFEAHDITKKGKVRFIGENCQISRGKKAFTLTGSIKENKLIAESLNYNYRAKSVDGKSVRLYGTVKRK